MKWIRLFLLMVAILACRYTMQGQIRAVAYSHVSGFASGENDQFAVFAVIQPATAIARTDNIALQVGLLPIPPLENSTSTITLNTSKIGLFPNPCIDWLYLDIEDGIGDGSVLKVFNINGRLIVSTSFLNQAGKFKLNVGNFERGVYSVILIKANGQVIPATNFVKI